MSEHKFIHCSSKPENQRTFGRKDGLWDHIRRFHHRHRETENPDIAKTMELWKRPNPELDPRALHCGFCGQKFPNWEERAQHVISHFQQGISLAAWWSLRIDNNFRHPHQNLIGQHTPGAGFNSPFFLCRCCPAMTEHVDDYHLMW
jgi:hypothetical protein